VSAFRPENVFATAHTIGSRQQLAYYAGRTDDVYRVAVLTYDSELDVHMFVNMDFASRDFALQFFTAYRQDETLRNRLAFALSEGFDVYKGD
jgi:hypothetical protein